MTQTEVVQASNAEIGLLGLQLPGDETTRFYSGIPTQSPSQPAWKADKAVVVNHQSLTVKDSGLSQNEQTDADMSQLLAQLASDAVYGQENQMREWFENYKHVLGQYCFWTIHGFEFMRYEAQEATFSLDKVALQILNNILSDVPQAEIEKLVKGAISTLTELAKKGDPDAPLFGTGHDGTKSAKCMIGYAYPGQSGPRIKLAAFHIQVTEIIDDLLLFKFRSKDTDMWYATAELEQSTDMFTQPRPGTNKSQRQLVQDKLYGRAEKGLQDLPLPKM